jgi:hypothetical protein
LGSRCVDRSKAQDCNHQDSANPRG